MYELILDTVLLFCSQC